MDPGNGLPHTGVTSSPLVITEIEEDHCGPDGCEVEVIETSEGSTLMAWIAIGLFPHSLALKE